MPKDDYEKLSNLIDRFSWFLPSQYYLGQVFPFFSINKDVADERGKKLAPHVKVLYLSPLLESIPYEVVVATVAHEIAHTVLEHVVLQSEEVRIRQERSLGTGR